MKKIFKIDDLAKKIKLLKNKKKTIALCHGVFDLLHVGHIKHFKEAKKISDYLIVSLTSDNFVNKGSGRPIFNQNLRAEFLSSLSIIDAIVFNNHVTAEKTILALKPNIYFKGPDYKDNKKDRTKNIYKEINAIKKVRGKISYSNDLVFSSSNLINNYLNDFNENQKKFIKKISKKYSFNFISKKVDEFKKQNILLIGETILDQYIFGEVLGKSGKEPHLVLNEKRYENYLGGAAAIANHLSSLCKKITFLTIANNKKSGVKFIKECLKGNINLKLIIDESFTTIIKKRFIDDFSKNKLHGSYQLNTNFELSLKSNNNAIKLVKKFLKKDKTILVSDYGHGFLTKEIINYLCKSNQFISVNAQMNASNQSFYSLEKYKNIDCLLINQNELRNALKDKTNSLEKLAANLAKKLNIKRLIITKGNEGSILLEKNKNIFHAPAFAKKIIDKVGAGDTMLAMMTLCMKCKLPGDLALFLSSIAAATTVENIGNSKFINKDQFLRKIEYLLK